jgi:hypothetical protein
MPRSGFEPRIAAVGSRRLTAWAMARPTLLCKTTLSLIFVIKEIYSTDHASMKLHGLSCLTDIITVLSRDRYNKKYKHNEIQITSNWPWKLFIKLLGKPISVNQVLNIVKDNGIDWWIKCHNSSQQSQWSEFLATNSEVPGSIPSATRFSEK